MRPPPGYHHLKEVPMHTGNKKIEFFEERAEEAAKEARNATLVNVRERALRSQAAWREMADRAIATEEERGRKSAEARQSDAAS